MLKGSGLAPPDHSSHLGGEKAAETQRTRRRDGVSAPFSDSFGSLRPLRLCGFSRSGRNGPVARNVTNGQSLPPRPPWLKSWAGTEPERSGGGVRHMLNRVN
jgi:hypothetical protein